MRFDRIGVLIAAYNEPRLPQLLKRFDFSVTPNVLIVDDGSTDGSTALAREYPIAVVRHEQRRGLGVVLRTGLTYWKVRGMEAVVTMTGSNKDDPAEIPLLVRPILEGRADYVQGSRFLDRRYAKGTPWKRRLTTRLVAAAWSLRFGRWLTDITNGFASYRLAIMDHSEVDISQAWLDGYQMQYYIHYKTLSFGYRYMEVPVHKIYPSDGLPTSKINLVRDWWSLISPPILLTLRLRR